MKENEEDYQKTKQQQQQKMWKQTNYSGEIWRNANKAVDVNDASYRTLTWRFYKIFIQVINGLLV